MVIVRLTGGLGNQMFQYALGRRMALDTKTDLWLDASPFAGAVARGETPRQYRLNFFRIQARLMPGWMRMLALPFPRHLPERFAKLPHWPGLVKRVAEHGKGYDSRIVQNKGRLYLDGYWQTEKYFAAVADAIRADFALIEPMTPPRRVLAGQMDARSVSVHVRRGDYVTNAAANAFHGTCSPEWYGQAMSKMAADIADARFFVFSDDPVWARANLPVYQGTVFVDPQPDGRDYEDMHLMASCAHHIIANSSYSWWGAWLNPSPDKKVIAPARWFVAEADSGDRIPSSWTRL